MDLDGLSSGNSYGSNKMRWFSSLVVGTLFLAGAVCPPNSASAAARPNILLIVVDDMGYRPPALEAIEMGPPRSNIFPLTTALGLT
jgi:hypothetical protein